MVFNREYRRKMEASFFRGDLRRVNREMRNVGWEIAKALRLPAIVAWLAKHVEAKA